MLARIVRHGAELLRTRPGFRRSGESIQPYWLPPALVALANRDDPLPIGILGATRISPAAVREAREDAAEEGTKCWQAGAEDTAV